MEHSPKIKALLEQISSGQLTSDLSKVLAFVKKRPGANKVLICAFFSPTSSHTITARLSDLEDLGLLEKKGTGKYSSYYFIAEPNAQRIHRAARKAHKLEATAKSMMKLYPQASEAFKNELQTLIKS